MPGARCQVPRLRRICAGTKPRDLPPGRHDIVTQDVEIAVGVLDLEVAMIGRQPLVEHFGDFNFPVAEAEAARCFFAAMTGVTLDLRDEEGWRF